MGRSNSGKSAIGKVVADKLGMRYISSGDIARSMDNIEDDLNNGRLAPEDRMRSAVLNKIISCDVSYILDGFPRFYDQYRWLKENFKHTMTYVYIHITDEDAISRARQRGRADDKSIDGKLEFFNEYTKPMILKIIDEEGIVPLIENGNDVNIQDSINALIEIIKRSTDVNNSEV